MCVYILDMASTAHHTTEDYAMHSTTLHIGSQLTLIDYQTTPDRYAVVRHYGDMFNEETVLVSDDITEVDAFINADIAKRDLSIR